MTFWDQPKGESDDVQGIDTWWLHQGLYPNNPYDTIMLGGIQAPGLVVFDVASKKRRVQSKKAVGSDGATPTFRGQDPAEGTMLVTIWTPPQYGVWDKMLPIIFPNPGKNVDKLSALDVMHPIAQHRGIKQIIITDVRGPENGPVVGAKTWGLTWVEYVAPPKAKATKTVVGAVAVAKPFQKTSAEAANNPKPPSQSGAGKPPKA